MTSKVGSYGKDRQDGRRENISILSIIIMKIPKIKKDESLAMWRERLAREFNLDLKMQELLREVSITSYIHGTNVTLEILKKEGRI